MASPVPDCIYKIVTGEIFDGARKSGVFPIMPIDARDGYVHFSTAAQLAETLRLHFAGQAGLVVFAIRPTDLPDMRWEPSRGGQLFPHAYGAVPASVVGRTVILSVAADGAVELPDWIR